MTDIASLVSLVRPDNVSTKRSNGAGAAVCSLIVVMCADRVLFGYNVERSQWELPGGSLDPGESSSEAALRELAEETGIQADAATLVALAEFRFMGSANIYRADIFTLELVEHPDLVESDELNEFRWWDPDVQLWDGMSALDAGVVRRIQSQEFDSGSSRR